MHFIRLRGPWQYQPLARTVWQASGHSREEAGELPGAGTIRLPGDWQAVFGDHFRGRVQFSRRFHCPTGLALDQRVWVAMAAVDCLAEISLNGIPCGSMIGTESDKRFDVTSLLEPQNLLTIVVDLPRETAESPPLPRPPGRDASAGGLVGEVCLQIE